MRIFSTVYLLVTAAALHAQAPDTVQHWKSRLNTGVSFNQASFSSNWSTGGSNSIGLNTVLNFKATYAKGAASWDNEVDLGYGLNQNQERGSRKTVDRLFVDTKYGSRLNDKWDLFAALNLLSQFDKGFKYQKDSTGQERPILISDWFAPAFITSALGLEYHPSRHFKARISPLAPRITIVNRVDRFVGVVGKEPYGVAPTDRYRIETLAFQSVVTVDTQLVENVKLTGRYELFANYQTLRLETIDQRLNVDLIAPVNKFMNVTLGGRLVYDYDQDPEVQLSESLTLGLVFTVQNYEEAKGR